MEAMWMCFIPLIQRTRQILRAGKIGRPCLLFADFGYPIVQDPQSRFLNPNLGGGSLLDRGIYPLSLAYYLFGEPDEVTGQAAVGATGVDEQSTALLKYREGHQAVLTSTMNAYSSNRATVVGTHGRIEIVAPFFRTERISVKTFPWAEPKPLPVDAAAPAGASRLRQILARGRRAACRLLNKDPNEVVYATSLTGNGYNYEASEVGRCLREGVLESAAMTGSESIAIVKAMDTLRAQWGVVYPNDP